MSKRPRKKKNNSNERLFRLRRAYTASYGVIRLNMDNCMVLDLKNHTLVRKPPKQLADAMTDTAFKWTIMLVVGCIERNGKFKLVTDQITFQDRRTQSQLQEYLSAEHAELVKDCEDKMDVQYVGWIGAPTNDIDFQPEQVAELFDVMRGDHAHRC